MPQDIPVEASEVLAFTPPSLAEKPDAPVFQLRAFTFRDKHFQLRRYRERGLRLHNQEALRQEVKTGLQALWAPEQCEQHLPMIEAYWQAQDDFALQIKIEPDAQWEYDAEIEQAISRLVTMIEDSWPPLRKMLADNAEFNDMLAPIIVSVIVKNWSNLDLTMQLDRGYLDLDCAETMLAALEARHGKMAVTELFLACLDRMNLNGETEKNSASPSLSATTQDPSTAIGTSDTAGKSPAPDSSTKTPESA